MDIIERIKGTRFPAGHDEKIVVRAQLSEEVAVHIREILQALPDDAMRNDVMQSIAICANCGRDHSKMYELRGWYMCSCAEEAE